MAEEDWVKLVKTPTALEAENLRNVLEAHEIETVAREEQLSQSYYEPMFQDNYVFVPREAEDTARRLVKETGNGKYLLPRATTEQSAGLPTWFGELLALFGYEVGDESETEEK